MAEPGKTYKDVYLAVRGKLPGVEDAKMRRCFRQENTLVVRLTRNADPEAIMNVIRVAAADIGKPTLVTEMGTLRATGIDMVATPKDLADVLSRDVGAQVNEAEVTLRVRADGLQTGRIRTSMRAVQLLEGRRVRVGCTVVVLQRQVPPPQHQGRCYRCTGTGHIARDCKGEDRRQCCLHCGSPDHRAAGCPATSKHLASSSQR